MVIFRVHLENDRYQSIACSVLVYGFSELSDPFVLSSRFLTNSRKLLKIRNKKREDIFPHVHLLAIVHTSERARGFNFS
jgi:hypothetical protein